MSVTSHTLASGPGWRVNDTRCTLGPQDRRFEEQHADISIAAVMQGTFQYRTRQGGAVLVPGALLLGNAGACFECGHDHAAGDRCLAFHFTQEFFEESLAHVAGVRRIDFAAPYLPPLALLMPLLAAAEAARDDTDGTELEELALRLAGTVATLLSPSRRRERPPNSRDIRRITAAVRKLECQSQELHSLAALAREAGVSRYHFLRTFRHVTGQTPHQFVLATRLHRAAVRLRRTADAISAIAFDAGFNDLSTFNRRFRRIFGVHPGAYRARR